MVTLKFSRQKFHKLLEDTIFHYYSYRQAGRIIGVHYTNFSNRQCKSMSADTLIKVLHFIHVRHTKYSMEDLFDLVTEREPYIEPK